jgi:hypothetical protein
MRSISITCILLFFSLSLFACRSNFSKPTALSTTVVVEEPTATETSTPVATFTTTPTLTPTDVPPTSTSTPTLTATLTPTLTPPPTMDPAQAKEMIRKFLKEPVDCAAPCFWGITPGQTTLGEATNILAELGIALEPVYPGFYKFYQAEYELGNGLSVQLNPTVKDGVIANTTVSIHPEKQRAGVKREWQAFSPDSLISRYGLPSRVGFSLGRVATNPDYNITIFYDELDMIIQYGSPEGRDSKICPLTDWIDYMRIWFGENPAHPPLTGGVPLVTATTMTMEEFGELMTGDPGKACFRLIDENMP